jgi:hypothetical protein
MIRIDRVKYRLLWRRKLGRDIAHVDAFGTPFYGTPKCCRALQQFRCYKATNAAWSLSMRSSSLSESLTSYVDQKQRRDSSRLDSVPNDLSEVVNKVLTFIELNHEDRNIREKYIRNFELARRRPFGDIDSHISESDDSIDTGASLNGVNGHGVKLNGHHLSFDEMVSDLSASNSSIRLESGYDDSFSVAKGLNGLNGSHHNSRTNVNLEEYSNYANDERSFQNTEGDVDERDIADLSPFDSIRAKYRHGYVNGAKSKESGEIAIYHALKNDLQSGGHIEEVRSITSKLDPVPFANVEVLLAQQTTTEDIVNAVVEDNQTDSVEVPELKCVSGDRIEHAAILPLESSHPSVFDELGSTVDLPLEGNLSLLASYDDRHLVTDLNSMVDQVENINSFSLNGLHKDSSLGMECVNGYVNNHNHINGYHDSTHKTNGYVMDPVSDKFGVNSEIGLDSLHKSVSDSVFVSKPLEALELATWFHSDFLDNDSGFFDRTSDNVVSEAEQARAEALFEAVILLRTLSEDHWNCFDLGDSHAMSISEESLDSTLNDSRSMEFSTRRTVDILSDMFSEDTPSSNEQLTTADYNFSLARIAVATDVAPDDILALLMQTHKQMTELYMAGFSDTRPNSITHEILLLALVRRFSAFHNAIDLVIALSKSPHFSWTPSSLLVASELCKRKDHLKMSREIMKDLQKWNAPQFVIPKRVFQNIIKVYKDNDARNDAIEMLRLGLKV